MYFNECPICGAHLDPGEKCDCEKEKGLSDANQHSPKEAGASSPHSIARSSKKVKPNPPHDLRVRKDLSIKEMVVTVRELYPRYDRFLQSKCEHGDEYGVDLRYDAFDALLAKFDPEALERARYIRGGRHKLRHKVMCRLTDSEYDDLMALLESKGTITIQAWLAALIRDAIIEFKKENANGENV